MRRRDLLVAAGAVSVALAIPPLLRRIPSDFNFEPLPLFEGFRRVSLGNVSGGDALLFGLGDRLPDQAPLEEIMPESPCLALFGPMGWEADRLPIAIFSDFNCPYCKRLEARLIGLRDSGAPIRLIWHELPLLGQSSLRYARAVLAAGFLGRAEQGRRYLSQNPFRPGPAALRDMAQALEVPPDMLLREYESVRVSQALSDSMKLGRLLGIPGTPGTVIGRTLVIGAIEQTDLNALIALERSQPRTVCL